MKRFICILFFLLFLPSLAIGKECHFPIFSSDSKINAFLLKIYVANNDNKFNFLSSDVGCLDTVFLAGELTQGKKMGKFELALKLSRLEVRLAKVLRSLYKDPNASVYLCPYEKRESEFRVITESTVKFMASKIGRSKNAVKDIIDEGYKKQNCQPVPKIEVEAGPKNIPPRIIAHILINLPNMLGKLFPPEALEDLNKSRPFESAPFVPVKSSSIPFM